MVATNCGGTLASNGKFSYWFAGTMITILLFLGNSVIANDKDSRSRDEKLNEKMVATCEKQTEVNQQILLALQDIKTEQRVTKELIKNGSKRVE